MMMKTNELRDAIEYTAQVTNFSPNFIEKDYYCSLILMFFYEQNLFKSDLIFKGGTLLSKSHLNFFRLSEDLDFSVSNKYCLVRTERKKFAEVIRSLISELLKRIGLEEVSPLKGFNESRQYNATFRYNSVIGSSETVKFEVGFRGDLLHEPAQTNLKTLLQNPFLKNEMIPPFLVCALSKEEAYAEKVRAALSRKNPAIRDYFDILKIAESGYNLLDNNFINLVTKKINLDEDAKIDLTLEKKKLLENKIRDELGSVLKIGTPFTLDKPWALLQEIYMKMSEQMK